MYNIIKILFSNTFFCRKIYLKFTKFLEKWTFGRNYVNSHVRPRHAHEWTIQQNATS